MSHTINEECINCGACIPECPQGAISEGSDKYIVDSEKCDDCGSCVEVCPTGATLVM